MINRIFKPKGSHIYRWRCRLRPEDTKINDISLGTSDRQAAEGIRAKKLQELQYERAGINPPKATCESVQTKARRSYLMAVYTGLRSRELAALKWGDLHLDAVTTFVRVRGSTRKNGKSAEMRLHPELADALRELKGRDVMDEPVFKRMPRIERFRRDLVKAGIAPQDRLGRKAVFDSLRHTFRHQPRAWGRGEPRSDGAHGHSDRRLTDRVCTDENLLGTWGAIDSLPSYAGAANSLPNFRRKRAKRVTACRNEGRGERREKRCKHW